MNQKKEPFQIEAMYLEDPLFLNDFLYRIAYPPKSLEEIIVLKDEKHRLDDTTSAWDYLQTFSDEPLSEEKIIQTGNRVNQTAPYISPGYRKIGSYMEDTKTPIPRGEEIKSLMQDLLETYETTWKDLEPLEREARFFLEMIRIHPFEDGNRRTTLLLVNSHLLEQGYAPVIISEDVNQEYLSSIDQNNVQGMIDLFHKQNHREYERLVSERNIQITKETRSIL